jgi:hypothetical protein
MKSLTNKLRRLAMILVIPVSGCISCLAQIPYATEPFERMNRSEFYGVGQYLHSDEVVFNGPAGDVKMQMDDTGLGGFGFAFHWVAYNDAEDVTTMIEGTFSIGWTF